MKLSDLIRQANEALTEYGDIEVATTFIDVPEYPALIEDAIVSAVLSDSGTHENAFILEYDRECIELTGAAWPRSA